MIPCLWWQDSTQDNPLSTADWQMLTYTRCLERWWPWHSLALRPNANLFDNGVTLTSPFPLTYPGDIDPQWPTTCQRDIVPQLRLHPRSFCCCSSMFSASRSLLRDTSTNEIECLLKIPMEKTKAECMERGWFFCSFWDRIWAALDRWGVFGGRKKSWCEEWARSGWGHPYLSYH